MVSVSLFLFLLLLLFVCFACAQGKNAQAYLNSTAFVLFFKYLPTLAVLLVNSLLLPEFIEQVPALSSRRPEAAAAAIRAQAAPRPGSLALPPHLAVARDSYLSDRQ